MSEGNSPMTMYANGTIVIGSIVKIDATRNNAVIAAGSGDKPFGVAQMGSRDASIPSITTSPSQCAIAGDQVLVYPIGHTTLVRVGTGGLTAGNDVKSGDATGVGVACTESSSDEWSVGQVIESASAGEYAKILVAPRKIHA